MYSLRSYCCFQKTQNLRPLETGSLAILGGQQFLLFSGQKKTVSCPYLVQQFRSIWVWCTMKDLVNPSASLSPLLVVPGHARCQGIKRTEMESQSWTKTAALSRLHFTVLLKVWWYFYYIMGVWEISKIMSGSVLSQKGNTSLLLIIATKITCAPPVFQPSTEHPLTSPVLYKILFFPHMRKLRHGSWGAVLLGGRARTQGQACWTPKRYEG